MSRINTNISSLEAIRTLNKNNADLATRLQRLSSGMRINSGKDDPAGLIASETLRSEIGGINQAIDNSQRAGNVINTAEGALSEVSSLLLEVQSLTNQAANSGALSQDEIDANQLQVDSILNSINRIANTTQFNGVKLLNGNYDYTVDSTTLTNAANVRVNSARLPDGGAPVHVAADVVTAATKASVDAGTAATTDNVTIEVAGNTGTEQLTFSSGTSLASIQTAVNAVTASTGVSAVMSGANLTFKSTQYGSDQFVHVNLKSGTLGAGNSNGTDAVVNVNGATANVRGTNVSFRNSNLDVEFQLDSTSNVDGGSASFDITGGGATFALGSKISETNKASLGLASVTTSNLGDTVNGYLADLASGGVNSLSSKNLLKAQRTIDTAIKQVSTLRGRLGAFQKEILDSNVNSLSVALENVTASESQIRDADFASETAAMTRAQILVQANTTVLAQANSSPQSVLSLLKGG